MNIFTSSLSGMNAAQYGISVTQHNIANANTPGYSQQVVNLTSRPSNNVGQGFSGNGVDVAGIQRIYSQSLSMQVRQETAQSQSIKTSLTASSQLENQIAGSNLDVSLQNMYDSFNQLTTQPTSVSTRQATLSSLKNTIDRFSSLDTKMNDLAHTVQQDITSSVQRINQYSSQIAAYNTSIQQASNGASNNSGNQAPNDLMDQRDQVIQLLSKESSISVQDPKDGSLTIFIGNGQPLVVGNQPFLLAPTQNPSDPSQLMVTISNQGTTTPLGNTKLISGNLGASLLLQNTTIENAKNQLGLLSAGLFSQINTQNSKGQDLNGALGKDLVSIPQPQVIPNSLNGGTATLQATITDFSLAQPSNYRLQLDGANYKVTRLSDQSVIYNSSAAPSSFDGITLASFGTMQSGDQFTLKPTSQVSSGMKLLTTDPNLLAAGLPIHSSTPLTNTGTAAIQSLRVDAATPLNSSIQTPVSITFNSPSTYTISGAVPAVAGNVNYVNGTAIQYNGWTASISGTPNTGDSFSIQTNTSAGDNRNASLLSASQNSLIFSNGKASAKNIYTQLVGNVGIQTQTLVATNTMQDQILSSTIANQQSVSGVNLDEEAANLIRYQQAYQASAKAMHIANTLFDTLLTI